ncbi:MAG: TerC family protein [Coriobacteriia bacterium]|nr:TerC family protein [Coriobacteriia bacterium]
MDLSFLLSPEALISLVTLIFLEIVLGVDNLVFITITSNKLPKEQQHLGRKLGLAGALVMRVIFLSFASFLVHMVDPLFTVDLGFFSHGFSVRDIVLFAGGAYLIYKGIVELRGVLGLVEEKEEYAKRHDDKPQATVKRIGLAQAVGSIMVMDLVFSIDSVITAVGLANQLIIMIAAVMIAVFVMMAFIDQISDFINKHVQMKILALTFIAVIGVLLVLDGLGIHTGMEVLEMHLEKFMVYFAMVFAFVLELIQMRYVGNLARFQRECAHRDKDQKGEKAAAAEPAVSDEQE